MKCMCFFLSHNKFNFYFDQHTKKPNVNLKYKKQKEGYNVTCLNASRVIIFHRLDHASYIKQRHQQRNRVSCT
jgi:hypothetical protein